MSTRALVKHVRSLRPSRAAIAALAGACCTFLAAALAVAQSPAPSASYTAGPGPSKASASAAATGTATAAAAAAPPGLAVAAYAWPTEASPEPKEDEWAGATALETLDKTVKSKVWWRRETLSCTQRAVREWMRITCTPESHATSYGVVWGMAGDLSTVKGKMPLQRDVSPDKALLLQNTFDTMTKDMGALATVTFQVRPGSATVFAVDEIEFVSDWGWSGVIARAGFVVDVSWALGEKAPSIEIR